MSYSDQELLDALREFFNEHGYVTSNTFTEAEDYPSYPTVANRFGSWEQALQKAGIPVDEAKQDTQEFTEEELLNEIARFKQEQEELTARRFDQHDEYPSTKTVQKRFGSWNSAIEKAGVELTQPTYTKKELLSLIQEFYDDYGETGDEFKEHPEYPDLRIVYDRFGSWETALVEAGIGTDSPECPNCGNHYNHLSKHFSRSSCEFPELSDRQKDIAIGLLMGDGTIGSLELGNHRLTAGMIVKDFIEWLDNIFGILSAGVTLRSTPEEKARQAGVDYPAENINAIWSWSSRDHPYFSQLREKWYPSGKKRFPEDLELTPDIAKIWYVGDGGLEWKGTNHSCHCSIASVNEADRPEFLESLFEKQGFTPNFDGTKLRFPLTETEKLLDWMGDPPPGFQYKWETDSRSRYDTLKQQSTDDSKMSR